MSLAYYGKDAAIYEAMHKVLVNNYMRLLEKGSYEYFVDKEPYGYLDEIIQMQALERSIKDDLSKKHAYRMVTLNFEEEADAEKVYLDIADLLDKKWIGEYWASLEYYAEDGTYSHPHIHVFMRLANLMKKKVILLGRFMAHSKVNFLLTCQRILSTLSRTKKKRTVIATLLAKLKRKLKRVLLRTCED